jgi:SpoVK/Ycf46/Vps4 family AAA+-type ATPase
MSQSVKADDMKDCENEKIAQDNKVSTNSDKEKDDVTMFHEEIPRYSFEDIILNNDTFESIQDVLTMYEKRDLIFNQWGLGQSQKLQNRVGINLYGASGTGKSMVAHAIANQLNRKILTVDYSQIESKYVGETSKNLVNMFDYAKKVNAVIFFDEADALLSKRVTNMSNATDVSVNQTRSTLLVLINEYDDLILYASNFITNYDPAFMRRILAHIKFELPNEGNRLKLWKKYIPDTLPTNVDVAVLAKKYDGISGSDIANAVMNASLRAARFDDRIVHHEYFENAIEQILKSKIDNAGLGEMVSKRTVSEEYVKTQLGKGI